MEFALAHPYLTTIIISVVAMALLGAMTTRGKDIVHHYYYDSSKTQPEKEEKKS